MQKRQSQIELLRIVCMMMIVMIHVLGQGGVLWYVKNFSVNYYIVWLLNSIILCAVNCFALISGYVGYRASFKPSKWFMLWFQLVFYSVLFLGIFTAISGDNFSMLQLKRAIMPFTQGQYWYISAYAGMFFFIPVLNGAVNHMRKKQLFGVLFSIFLLYTILPTMFHQDPFQLQYGYCVLWLCLLYVAGAFLGKYEIPARVGQKKGLVLYLSCTAITWLGKTLVEFVTFSKLGEIKFGYIFMDYTTPFTVLAAVGLLIFFANIRIRSEKTGKAIGVLASATLGVYILHVQPFIIYQLITDMTVWLANEAAWKMFLWIILDVLVIYIVCTVVELIRIRLFIWLHIPQFSVFLEKKARKCFDQLCRKLGIED